jgi:hypothetical protein
VFDKQIEAAVEKALDRRTVRPDRRLTLEGYHPLPEIMGTLYEWLFVPFRGTDILVEVRYPRSTQLPEVDKVASIITGRKEGTKLSRKEMIDVLNIQEECCKAVLNRPAFEELERAITGKDRALEIRRNRLAEIDEKLKLVRDAAVRLELHRERDRAELFCGYVLPDDTMLALTTIALGMDVSDIRKLTKDKLLAAYGKARLYGGRPSDFVPGLFTDGDRQNIDDHATVIGGEAEVHRIKNSRPARNV